MQPTAYRRWGAECPYLVELAGWTIGVSGPAPVAPWLPDGPLEEESHEPSIGIGADGDFRCLDRRRGDLQTEGGNSDRDSLSRRHLLVVRRR